MRQGSACALNLTHSSFCQTQAGINSAVLRIPTDRYDLHSNCTVISIQSIQSTYKIPYCPARWSGDELDIDVKHLLTRHYQFLKGGYPRNVLYITMNGVGVGSERAPVKLVLRYGVISKSGK